MPAIKRCAHARHVSTPHNPIFTVAGPSQPMTVPKMGVHNNSVDLETADLPAQKATLVDTV